MTKKNKTRLPYDINPADPELKAALLEALPELEKRGYVFEPAFDEHGREIGLRLLSKPD